MNAAATNFVLKLAFWCTLLIGLPLAPPVSADASVHLSLPKHRLPTNELAVIVNDDDQLSVNIGNYYVQARGLPAENLVHVRFAPGRRNMSADEFAPLRAAIERGTPANVQAYAITWAEPYRVDCMSFTSALTFGFDRSWCSSHRCAPTRHSPYFGYSGSAPLTDLGIRPSISIAGTNFADARALIDRGIAADGSLPRGTAYLVSTSDKARNVRAQGYRQIESLLQTRIKTQIVNADALRDRDDVMFYFTGVKKVTDLDTLKFLPGALADHLTSSGGQLVGSRQMSAMRWLQAGATGSYGTVVEPCNLIGKFPNPGLLMDVYTSGRTLIEAYWQSVQQPGEGIFIGDPLAAPFDGQKTRIENNWLHLSTRTLLPGPYALLFADTPDGPWRTLAMLEVAWHENDFMLPSAGDGYYQLKARSAGPLTGRK